MTDFHIRSPRGPEEYSALVENWRSAVDATHSFLSDHDRDEIESHLAADYFPAVQLSVAESNEGPVGFCGVADGDLAMLFVDSGHHGQGVGTALLDHAIEHSHVTTVDVNEQNEGAKGFYIRRGFEFVGRSETDEAGRPYPLLHMELVRGVAAQTNSR